MAFFRDITEFRKKARESEQRVRTIPQCLLHHRGERGHAEKVLSIIESLGPLLRFSREEQDTLNISARLFQVGKLFVPRHLLNKRGKLTPEEYAQVSKAPEAAYELLYSLNFGLPVAEPCTRWTSAWTDAARAVSRATRSCSRSACSPWSTPSAPW